MRMQINVNRIKYRFIQIILLVTCCALLVTSVGCEAFVRKFTRKKKKEKLPREEMVLVPEEYKGPQMTEEQLYRQYFLFWKSWQDELITALSVTSPSHKKQIDCVNEAIKNLMNLRLFLVEERQKKLDVYIGQLEDLKESITKDLYSRNMANNCRKAERIKRNILRDFSYYKVKKDVIYSTEFSETY